MIPSHWRRHPSFPILNASLQEAASPCAHCSRKGFTLILSAGTSWSLRQSASPWEGARAACGSSQLCSNRAAVAVNINGKSPPSVPSCAHVGFSPRSHCISVSRVPMVTPFTQRRVWQNRIFLEILREKGTAKTFRVVQQILRQTSPSISLLSLPTLPSPLLHAVIPPCAKLHCW